MNIIKVDKEDFEIENQNIKIDIKVDKLNLIVNGNVCIYDYNINKNLELNIKVNNNSSLTYYMFSDNSFDTKIINIDNFDNSKTNFNYSFKTDSDCNLKINNNILENDIDSIIRVRGVSLKKANIIIDSNGYVKKDTSNNNFNEDLRGLFLKDGDIKINPNMYIDSNDVIANHNSTIGSINKDYLFYLNSKMIDNKDAKKLIVSGFINSILDSEKIKNK